MGVNIYKHKACGHWHFVLMTAGFCLYDEVIFMSNIIIDARLLKAYDALNEIGRFTGRDEEFIENLWSEFSQNEDLMSEFIYYLDYHCFCDKAKCMGYGMTDIYFYLMRCYEVGQDIGKNYKDCDKEALSLECFMMMAKMIKDPEPYIKKLQKGLGMDYMP